MYLDFFSLTEKPFNVTPDTRFFYLSPQHEEAITTMLYGIRERRGFVVLTGEVGTGKTTSIRALLNRIQGLPGSGLLGPGLSEKGAEPLETALIINPLLSVVELIRAINKDFGCDGIGAGSARVGSVQTQLEALNSFLLKNDQAGGNAAVIIDEAQDLSAESLEMLRLLSNLETESHKLLQLILVGQPELEKKLATSELRQLRQRIQLRYELRPLDVKGTEEYITYRIRKVAPKSCIAFRSAAIRKIYEYSSGIPRLINTLCDLTLMTAYTAETHIITGKIVDQAFVELDDKSWVLPKRFLGWGRKAAGSP